MEYSMIELSSIDVAVIDRLRHEFESIDEVSPEGPNSVVTVDPTEVQSNGERQSIFHAPLQGTYMDYGFRFDCKFHDALQPEIDYAIRETTIREVTPYTDLVIKELLQAWADVGAENYPGQATADWFYSKIVGGNDDGIELSLYTWHDPTMSVDEVRQRTYDHETVLYYIDYTETTLIRHY